jgi:hypothetical protein
MTQEGLIDALKASSFEAPNTIIKRAASFQVYFKLYRSFINLGLNRTRALMGIPFRLQEPISYLN